MDEPKDKAPQAGTAVRVMTYSTTDLQEREHIPPAELAVPPGGQPVTWIDVSGLGDPQAMQAIGERLDLHQLLLETVLGSDDRPMIVDLDDRLFVVIKVLELDQSADELRVRQAGFVLGKNYLISFLETGDDLFELVRERIRRGTGRLRRKGADFLLYVLLDLIVDRYIDLVESIGERLEELEENTFDRPGADDLATLRGLRRQLILVGRQIMPTRELSGKLNLMSSGLIDKGTRRYISDLQNHTQHLAESIAMFRDQLANLENAYHAALNMRMTQAMRLLTVISTIFIPLTFIVGIYGMNFDRMPELHWRFGYPAVMGSMLLIALLMLWLFRRKGWL